jgi:membrane-bound lytic murein transglycosylase D
VALEEIAASHALPVEVNDRVTRWMGRFVGDQRPTFEQFLSREGLYGDMIRGKLRDRGMPEDLIYLAMIESGFQPLATSSVEATHARFGSWYLAAAAYNAGPGRVSRALRRHGGDLEGDEELYWEIIDHLPRETREYVPRLIAATLLARRADDLGFAGETEDPYRYDRVWVPGGTRLHTVANSLDVPLSRMKDLNPHLIRGATPPGGSYALRVPQGRSAAVVAALAGASSSWLTD